MALVATRKERKGKMGMDQGENPSVLWFVSFSIISTMFCGQFFSSSITFQCNFSSETVGC